MKISLKKVLMVLLIGFLFGGSIYGISRSMYKSNSRRIYYRNETNEGNEEDDSGSDTGEEGSGEGSEEGGSSEQDTGTEFEENVTQECKDFFRENDPLFHYGITMTLNSDKTTATISMNLTETYEDEEIEKAMKAMAFKIVKINDTDVSSDEKYSKDNMILKNKGSISLPVEIKTGEDGGEFVVYLESALNTQDPVCTGVSHFEVAYEDEGNVVRDNVTLTGTVEEKSYTYYSTDACENLTSSSDSKLKEYCQFVDSLKGKTTQINIDADSASNKNRFVNNRFKDSKLGTFDLFCPAVGDNGKIAATLKRKDWNLEEDPNNDEYYINHAILKASKTYTIPGVTYEYNYAPGTEAGTSSSGSCKVKCSETVTVDYGPPQVVRAGICLEYFIRIKSVVECNTTGDKPKKPDKNFNYCVPVPWCVHGTSGRLLHQAGPDDNFDDCINDCDGGKYTTKCSDVCYKKLYGSSSSVFNNMYSFDSYSVRTQKLAGETNVSGLNYCLNISKNYPFRTWNYTVGQDTDIYYQQKDYFYPEIESRRDVNPNGIYVNPDGTYGAYWGCYYWSGDSIMWSGNSSQTPVRWYSIRDDYGYPNGKPYGGTDCTYALDNTYQCGKPYGTKNNSDGIFYKWKNGTLCDANCYLSGCSKDEYLNPGVMAEDYKNNMDKYNALISECNAAASCTTSQATYKISVDNGVAVPTLDNDFTDSKATRDENGNEDVPKKLNSSNYLVDFGGCYEKTYNNSVYKAEIGVQSSWIRNKNGIVSYTPKTSRAYYKVKNKFCFPEKIPEVNKKWWLFFYTSFYKDKLGDLSINDDLLEHIINFESVTEFEESDVEKYNINGVIKNFGHFGWNINVNCFFAYKKYNGEYEDKYRIRTVDLANLFPDESESGTRLPGFNWSKYANGSTKTGDFVISPSDYAKWVEKNNYAVYSEDYLDYEVKLSSSDVRNIRDNYSTFVSNIDDNINTGKNNSNGDYKVNDVLTYHSKLLDSLGTDKVKRPSGEALKCNNIVNWNVTNRCDTSFTISDDEEVVGENSISNIDNLMKNASTNNNTKPVLTK